MNKLKEQNIWIGNKESVLLKLGYRELFSKINGVLPVFQKS